MTVKRPPAGIRNQTNAIPFGRFYRDHLIAIAEALQEAGGVYFKCCHGYEGDDPSDFNSFPERLDSLRIQDYPFDREPEPDRSRIAIVLDDKKAFIERVNPSLRHDGAADRIFRMAHLQRSKLRDVLGVGAIALYTYGVIGISFAIVILMRLAFPNLNTSISTASGIIVGVAILVISNRRIIKWFRGSLIIHNIYQKEAAASFWKRKRDDFIVGTSVSTAFLIIGIVIGRLLA
ncbi:hypothetical protein ACFWYW_33585 [Nonomuraea sp. NPDC059023]|uniref:hypothetical protein n=1 Tax=unclassified Nonomuraea TaxID=2593643 RepID=UPI0036AEA226